MRHESLKRIMAGFVVVGLALMTNVHSFGRTTRNEKYVNSTEGSPMPKVKALSLDPTGMAKPIADLRDYNGTYYGASGTGTKGYEGGTLYRDNEDNGVTSLSR